MRLVLVSMPWAVVDFPSIALGILKRSVAKKMPDVEIETLYANIAYADWIAEHCEFGSADYKFYSDDSYFFGCGDWVFSSSLHDTPEWRPQEYEELMDGRVPDHQLKTSRALHELSGQFVRDIAERVAALEPDVVGFTTTFQQNAATLAAAREIKKLGPRIVTVLGGANCDGAQGAALHRNFPFIDFVVRGEGELAFPRLLGALRDGEGFIDIPGLCWRDESATPVANAMTMRPLSPSDMVMPDYDDYFAQWASSRVAGWSAPVLVVEAARGCWWGEKHHCTFCGLNGSFMQFRSKSPGTFFDEIVTLAERHRILDVCVVDNILDMSYITSLVPRLIQSGYDLRFHYEIKSNLRLDQLRQLAEAGIVAVQPGIESLSSHVLRLMDKGVSGCQNVRLLRDAASVGVVTSWNYLYGFPGETSEDYELVLSQIPTLHHLMPPENVNRIAIERFSPYFDRPELGFTDLKPTAQSSLIYGLPEAELLDISYIFDAAPGGIDEDAADRLREVLDGWRDEANRSRLTQCDLGDRIVLVSRRAHFDWTVLRIDDPVECAAFRLLEQPRSVQTLVRKLSEQVDGDISPSGVEGLLRRWRAFGLIFEDEGQIIHVVPEAVNEELLRVGAAVHAHEAGRHEPSLPHA